MSSHYDVLGIERKMKALVRNPDPLQERIVKDAFSVLSNPVKRADYD